MSTEDYYARLRLPEVISVQSQVIRGCVGNSIAFPALTRHGLDVLAVPTCIFGHTPDGQPTSGGEMPDAWFSGFLSEISNRGLDTGLRAAVTGYIGTPSKAKDLLCWLTRCLVLRPDLLVVIDPVLGDEDTGYYVEAALTDWYKEKLLPLATGLTPNFFELECLTGQELKTPCDIIQAAKSLITGRVRWVIVTSAIQSPNHRSVGVMCVTAISDFMIHHNFHPGAPKGTGDLFTAELTAALLRGFTLKAAVKAACALVHQSVITAMESRSEQLKPATSY